MGGVREDAAAQVPEVRHLPKCRRARRREKWRACFVFNEFELRTLWRARCRIQPVPGLDLDSGIATLKKST